MANRFRYVVCDVFTDEPLAGNQLAVFTDARAKTCSDSRSKINFSQASL
jgi:predicted PhzF superfamily epimerase YddE/YHI9